MLDRILDRTPWLAVSAFAGWTLLCELAVAFGHGLVVLERAVAVVLIAASAGAWWRRGRGRIRGTDARTAEVPPDLEGGPSTAESASAGRWRLALVFAAALGLAIAWKFSGSTWVISLGGTALAAVGLWSRRGNADPPRPTTPKPHGPLLLGIALGSAVLVSIAHNPDPDDAFYLNVAAQVATDPAAPMLVHDGIFGIEGMPIQLPLYRAHGIEVLVGAVAHLTGLEPIVVAHVGLVACAGFLLPLAVARLMRRFAPDRATLGALLTVIVLVACGEGVQGPGHFALLRLQQGKGVLLAIVIPLIVDAALEFVQRPTRGAWWRLFAAQVAAVGLTSSALFVAPLVALTTLIAASGLRRPHWRALGLGATASLHAASVLVWLGPAMVAHVRALGEVLTTGPSTSELSALARTTLVRALGESPWTLLLLAAVLASWAVPASRAQARAIAASLLVAFGVFLSPLFAPWIAATVLPVDVYFRVMWTVPWAVLAALTLVSLPQLLLADRPGAPVPAWRRRARGALIVAAMCAPVALSPTTVLDPSIQTEIGPPGLKVPDRAYEAARWLANALPPHAYVLVDDDVAPWVSTFRAMPHPLYSRYIYERFLLLGLPSEEVHKRRTLAGFVSRKGLHLDRTDVLCFHADVWALQGIVLRDFGERTERQVAMLQSCGFQVVGRNDLYAVLVRDAVRAPDARP